MKKLLLLPLAGLVVLAACNEDPVGMVAADGSAANEIVVTPGVAAPPRTPGRPVFSTLEKAQLNVGGSVTSPLHVKGDNCAEHPAQKVIITYTVSGNQDSPASFKVFPTWDYDGNKFNPVRSDTTTVSLPKKQGGGNATHTVTLTVTNSTKAGSGSTSFRVEPFGLDTNQNDSPGKQLTLDASSSATVYVIFDVCEQGTPSDPVPDTPPTLSFPTIPPAEAESSAGAPVDFLVTASGFGDFDLTDLVVCKVGDKEVASGDTFPLGETTVNCSVTDPRNNKSASGSFVIEVVDTTAPEFRRNGEAMGPDEVFTVFATGPSGRAFDLGELGITAFDLVAGDVTDRITCNPATGSFLDIGIDSHATVVECKATDDHDNTAEITFKVNVTLQGLGPNGLGFLSPLRMSAPFSAHKGGSAIPHKFPAPKYPDGTPATDWANDLEFKLTWQKDDSEYTVPADDVGSAAGSTVWRYDPASGHYIFNLKTDKKIMKTGFWTTAVYYRGLTLAKTTFNIDK